MHLVCDNFICAARREDCPNECSECDITSDTFQCLYCLKSDTIECSAYLQREFKRSWRSWYQKYGRSLYHD
ncbi:MAG: hypothetical protein E7505_05265 [Ruminococcus sp.]|nr:hypothetical protein [Ruminococcus sp.]